jgi:hypothetical protein
MSSIVSSPVATRTASESMSLRAGVRIGAEDPNGYADTSPAPRSRTDG